MQLYVAVVLVAVMILVKQRNSKDVTSHPDVMNKHKIMYACTPQISAWKTVLPFPFSLSLSLFSPLPPSPPSLPSLPPSPPQGVSVYFSRADGLAGVHLGIWTAHDIPAQLPMF